MADPEVLVVGGGPAGLATATDLARAGRRVAVLEREGQEAIGDDAANPRFIRTIWGVGYVLAPGTDA